jgi:GH24 family phage-related lysozyme (muramidase)
MAVAQTDMFERLLAEAATNPALLEAANALREKFQLMPGDPKGAQAGFRERKGTHSLSDRAKRLLITFEVSGKSTYEKRYQRPTWPGGVSGVTVGIGYDLGYVTQAMCQADWAMLDESSLEALVRCCGKRSEAAKEQILSLTDVQISWQQASDQFDAFLPYAIGQTENTFRNCELLSDDSFGALLSLVYNRGPSLSPVSARRKEMREIAQLMADKKFIDVPDKIRDMKRLWTQDNERGLVLRRELEATLFEEGLRA